MKHTVLLTCICGLLFLCGCKSHTAQNERPLEVMTFNIRLDAPSDSANNWKYRKDNVCRMIAYYQPDLLGMQEVCHNQMEDLKQGLPQYTALGVGRDDGKEAGEYCPIFFNTGRFTLVEYGNFSLSEQPETIGIKGWDASYNRITTWAILQEKSNGKKLVFFNTHLDNDGAIARKEGVQLILNKIRVCLPSSPATSTVHLMKPPCRLWKKEEWKTPRKRQPSPMVRPGLSTTSDACRQKNAYCWTTYLQPAERKPPVTVSSRMPRRTVSSPTTALFSLI